MPNIASKLELERCPHCNIARPHLALHGGFIDTRSHNGANPRRWGVYVCASCGGVVTAAGRLGTNNTVDPMSECYPSATTIDEAIPGPARRYLAQANESLHAPDGAVMLAASAVDAMLKARGYTEGSLYPRINRAAAENVITEDMAIWAHQVRLEANKPRHADEVEPHADQEAAKRAVEFATALGQLLFVLPSKVTRGVKAAGGIPTSEGGKMPPATER